MVVRDSSDVESVLGTLQAGLGGGLADPAGERVPGHVESEGRTSPLALLGDQADAIESTPLEAFPHRRGARRAVPICQKPNDLLAPRASFDRGMIPDLRPSHEFRTRSRSPERVRGGVVLAGGERHRAARGAGGRVADGAPRRDLVPPNGRSERRDGASEPVDVGTWSNRCGIEPRAKERGIRMKHAHGRECRDRDRPTLLRSILTNLLMNAVDHSPDSTIECDRAPRPRPQLRKSSTGPWPWERGICVSSSRPEEGPGAVGQPAHGPTGDRLGLRGRPRHETRCEPGTAHSPRRFDRNPVSPSGTGAPAWRRAEPSYRGHPRSSLSARASGENPPAMTKPRIEAFYPARRSQRRLVLLTLVVPPATEDESAAT